MNFNKPLYAPQYAKLRAKSYAGTRLVSIFSNEVVFAGRVNSDLTTPQSWAEFLYTSISVGAYTDVEDLFVLYIGVANDIKLATFQGYCRGEADATKVYCNESSQDFVAGAYFWVVKRIDIKYVQSRPSTSDPTTAVELINYDQTYQGMLPAVIGLQTGYVGYVNPSTNKLRLAFDVSGSSDGQSGGTLTGFLYDLGGATVVAGALNESIVVADFTYGELYGKCSVTNSGGLTKVRRFGIKVHNRTNYPPDTGFEGGSIAVTLEQGYTATLPAFAGVDDVLNNSFAMMWRADEQFDGVSGSLWGDAASAAVTNKVLTSNVATLTSAAHPFEAGQTLIIADVGTPFDGTFQVTATTVNTFSYTVIYTNVGSAAASGMAVRNPSNLDFVGWLSREDDPLQGDPTYSVIATARFSFTGVGPRLARLTAQLVAIINGASPSRWGDILNCTPWRAMKHFWDRYTTLTTLCDVSFDDSTDTFLFTSLSSQGKNALSAVGEIAQQITANIEYAPWGALAINRDMNYLTDAERAYLTVVGTWTTADASGAPRSIDPNPDTGKVDGVGASYSSAAAQVTAFSARAPGHAQGEGQGDDTIAAQVLAATDTPTDALDELRQRVGSRLNLVNLRESLDVKHTGAFVGLPLIPSRSQIHWWDLQNVGGPNNVNRIDYDTSVWWTIDSVTQDYNAKGVFSIRTRYRRVAEVGDPGDDTTAVLPAPGQIPALPDLGQNAFNFQLPELSFPDTGLALTQINPAKLLPPTIGSTPLLVKTDGDTLIAWSATRLELVQNFIALRYPQTREINPPTLGAYLHKMALFDPANGGMSTGNNVAYDLASDGTNSRVFKAATVFAPVPLWLTGNTFAGVYSVLRNTGTPNSLMVLSPFDSGSGTINLTYPTIGGGPPASGPASVSSGVPFTVTSGKQSGVDNIQVNISPCSIMSYVSNTGWVLYSGHAIGGSWNQVDCAAVNHDEFGTPDISTMPNAEVSILGINSNTAFTFTMILVSGGTVTVRLSADGGINFGSPVTVGTGGGPTYGFDTQRVGGVSYAACAAKVRKATTLGGAYSDHTAYAGANPVSIVIPWYLWGTNTLANLNTSNANPDYIVALDQADTGTNTLYKVNGTTAAKTNITPVAGITFDSANCITTMYGTHIAVIGKVSGVYKLYTSPDAGATWTLAATLGTATFVHNRRGDTRAKTDTTGVAGQLYVCDGNGEYSSKFGSAGVFPRTLPISPLGIDVLG